MSDGADDDIDLRSAPAQKQPPAPVRITTLTSGSVLARSHASLMIDIISADSALRASGRFIVTTRVLPSSSTKQCGSWGS